ncbi:MAG: hypothetical protein OXM57_05985 [bacterium]|nr:hypothetical protein [bacterium]MDE0352221.1 hypothetical protein [bacterium]
MPPLDWIGVVTLFGIAVSINWWVVKSYSDRMERRFDQQDARFDKRFDGQDARFGKRFDGQDARLDRQERRLERLETLMLSLVRDVGLLMGAMGIYPAAKAKAGSGE